MSEEVRVGSDVVSGVTFEIGVGFVGTKVGFDNG